MDIRTHARAHTHTHAHACTHTHTLPPCPQASSSEAGHPAPHSNTAPQTGGQPSRKMVEALLNLLRSYPGGLTGKLGGLALLYSLEISLP